MDGAPLWMEVVQTLKEAKARECNSSRHQSPGPT